MITIEDSAELQIQQVKNLVRLETRTANSQGEGVIGIGDLIRASLRMNPDRIIVGEVRGKEALELLNSFNTGHDGGLSSAHANSPKDMLAPFRDHGSHGGGPAPGGHPEPDRVSSGYSDPLREGGGQEQKSIVDRGGR